MNADQLLKMLDRFLSKHEHGEISISRIGSDRLVSLRTHSSDGAYLGQSESFRVALREAIEHEQRRGGPGN